MNVNWKEQTLEQLEKEVWNDSNSLDRLAQACNRLRKQPIKEFEIEDLRIMIGQNIGLKYLIPISIEKLSEDLFLSGDFYEGDLLQAILKIDINFWKENSTLKERVLELIVGKEEELKENKIKFEEF